MGGSDTTLQIIIKLRDEASAALSGFNSTLEKNRIAIASVGVAAGAAFAGIFEFAKSSVDAAGESDKAIAQLNAVIKSTGDASGVTAKQMIDFAESMQQTTTYSNEAVLRTEDLLLTFTAIGKDVMPQATTAVLDMATALREDTSDAAIQLGKALQDPILGVTALRRVGVDFNAQQQELIKTMMESGHQLEAQQYILKELNKEFGGSAAAAADTYAGKVEQLNNDWGDMQKQIGHAIIPMLLQLAQAILPIVLVVTQWIEAHPKLTAVILIGTAALTGLVAILAALALALPVITAGFATMGVVLGLLTAPVLLLGLLIAGLAVIVIKNWDNIKTGTQVLVDFLKSMWQKATDDVNAFLAVVQNSVNAVLSFINSVKSAASSVGSAVGGAASTVYHTIVPHLAAGGIVNGPTLALIGEAGPEAVVPLNRASGFGGGITVNITGNNISDKLDMRDIAEMASAEIVKALRGNQRLAI